MPQQLSSPQMVGHHNPGLVRLILKLLQEQEQEQASLPYKRKKSSKDVASSEGD